MSLNARARSGTLPATLIVLALLGVLPFLPLPDRMLAVLTFAVIFAIAAVGLDLFSGYSGQPSFGNFGFVAVGAYSSAMLTTGAGWPVLATLPVAIVASAAISLVLGLAMVRLPGLGGALITFFFAFVTFVLLNGQAFQPWTMGANGIPVEPLVIGDLQFSYGRPLYFLSWGALVVIALLSDRYANSRAGRALRVVKRGDVLAASMGISVRAARLCSFTFSAVVAGIAGWLLAQALGYLSPENFPGIESVNLVAMVVVGGLGSICGPIIGAVFFGVVSDLARDAGGSRELIFALLLLVSLIFLPGGLFSVLDALVGSAARLARRDVPTGAGGPPPRSARAAVAARTEPRSTDTTPLLAVRDVRVAFGGITALDGINLRLQRGEIYSIMGPNGAGKTTLLNCISGIQPYQGDVLLEGRSLSSLRPAQIRRAGISRTFQHPSLVGDLTAEENVASGTYGLQPTLPYLDILPLPGALARDRSARIQAGAALDLVGFPAHRRGVLASDLSLAEQKIVDIARSIAGSSRLLLLDEPTAGLSEEDIGRIVEVLRTVNQQTGLTILVIAHHIGFLRAVAGPATVLHFGRELASGPIDEVTRLDEVVEVFLG